MCLSAVDFQSKTGSGIAVEIVTIHFYKSLLSGVEQSVVYHWTARSTQSVLCWGEVEVDHHGVLHAPLSGCVWMGREDACYGRGPKLYCPSLLGVFHLLLPAEPTGLHKPCFVLWVCPVFQRESCQFAYEGKESWEDFCLLQAVWRGQQNITFGLFSLKTENGLPVVEGGT